MNFKKYTRQIKQKINRVWQIFKRAVGHFIEDDIVTRGAALAFFTALSLSPLLVIFMVVTGFIGEELQGQILTEIQTLISPQAQEMIAVVIKNAREHQFSGMVSAIFSILILIFSGTRMFVQLQGGLNFIWKVEPKPSHRVIIWFQRRLSSLIMMAAIFLLLLASLIITTVLNVIFAQSSTIWQWINFLVSLLIYTGLFTLVFRFFPDVNLKWRDVIPGAVSTAILYDIGQWAIGKYLGITGWGSTYGAAGSMVFLLLWVYYSSLILYFGMEIIQSYLKESGREINPESQARWMKLEEGSRAPVSEI